MLKRKYDLVYFMGDSFTHGYGQGDDVNKEVDVPAKTFAGIISNHYQLELINDSLPGCGNFHIYKTIYDRIPALLEQNKNPLVFIGYTDPARQEFYFNNKGNAEIINSANCSFYKEYMIENYNPDYFNKCSKYYVHSIRSLLLLHKIDFIEYCSMMPIEGVATEIQNPLLEIAGKEGSFIIPDLKVPGHPNLLGHRKIADKIINKVNELYGTS